MAPVAAYAHTNVGSMHAAAITMHGMNGGKVSHWLIRLHFDMNYTQNHHPVPFLCPWPVAVPDWWTSNLLSSKFHSSS
jgi:hypothetical protein